MDQYVLSLSYGKDSLACLGAIDKLGLPLDRIIHAEVWATDTIPADLPPMVDFKKKADDIIKYRWGIEVEHVYATYRGGVRTYEGTFYELHERGKHIGQLRGFPMQRGAWCQDRLKASALDRCAKADLREDILSKAQFTRGGAAQSTDSRWSREFGATATSNGVCYTDHGICDPVEPVLHRGTQANSYYGFPISVRRGNWCTQLKTRVFRQRPVTRRGYKYRAIFRDRR